jgi:hypothetical protein
MMRKRLHIRAQWYECFDGSKPLTWAVYNGREFLCYSWTLEGAKRAMEYLKERWT